MPTKVFGQHLPGDIRVIAPERLIAHADWLDGSGGQQLRWEDGDAPGARLDTLNLSGAQVIGGFFDRADFTRTRFHCAALWEMRAHEARFVQAMLAGTAITRCDFAGATFTLANFGDAVIAYTDFSTARLARSTWYRSKLSRCSFARATLRDALFDHTELVDCDFRGCDLGEEAPGVAGTMIATSFIRCDFRESTWSNREIWSARFIDCKFDGAPPRVLTPSELGQRVLDGAIDAGATFERTVEQLIAVGFTHENALEIVIDPASARECAFAT